MLMIQDVSFHTIGPSMKFILQSWQLFFIIIADGVNKQQQEVIEYLRTESQVLKEKLGKKRILLNDDQRRRLAV
ncbi:hypothetical protein Pan161_14580 [Gimesia algae]|uniref:Uncharacterized protein n=1 Tax=Gimesia algae TaxID=2527971 RepID=A0A517VA00_9PLAN|nr:hypothetical protein Pan161_14580 [Gimesia algae]